nr:excalibur calcium-binding domain-containing protein [Nitratireductor luteus]
MAAPPELRVSTPSDVVQAQASCKAVSSCREAVVMWCNGYRRADGDGDGIPCENVCPDKRLVDQIRREIGC